ncbi:hypothetical protein [Hymenobacter terrenus]|uniref:hypothetical protein n=1 Tax=Hymenobacter terrenus TaxID=1629124 RepID=UPI000619C7FF|nr:hypothetical protein [Hymenobacter terrenus]
MTPTPTPPQTPVRIAFTAFAMVYLLGGAAYLAYGFATHTGLSGWLINWQMQHFDEADNSLTLVGCVLAWVLSLVPMFYGLVRLNRSEGFTPTFPGQQPAAGAPAAMRGMATPVRTYQDQQNALYSRRGRTIAALVCVAVSGAAFLYLTLAEAHLAAQSVYSLDLNTKATLPAEAELATVHGVLAANYGFVLEETKSGSTKSRTTYAPLLPANWKPGQPVRFVVKTKVPVYQNFTTGRVFFLDSAQAFPATYDGRLSRNDLPTYVSQHYAGQRLTLATPYYMLDDSEVAGGRPVLPSSSRRWIALAVGLFAAVGCFMMKQPTAR